MVDRQMTENIDEILRQIVTVNPKNEAVESLMSRLSRQHVLEPSERLSSVNQWVCDLPWKLVRGEALPTQHLEAIVDLQRRKDPFLLRQNFAALKGKCLECFCSFYRKF